MADIDNLSIQISANAASATKAIKSLQSQLNNLKGSMSKLNGDSMKDFSTAVNSLAKADGSKISSLASSITALSNAAQGMKGMRSSNFSNLANAITTLNSVDTSKFAGISSDIGQLATSMSRVGTMTINTDGIVNIATAVNKLGGVKASAATQNLMTLKDNLAQFVRSMNSVGSLTFDVTSISNMVSSISKLGGKGATQATSNLPTLSAQLQNFVRQMNQIGSLQFDMTGLNAMTTAISQLGHKGVQTAIANLPQLTTELANMMNTLARAPAIASSTVQMANAIANLAASLKGTCATSTKTSSLFSGLGSSGKKASSGLSLFSKSAKSAQKSSFSLASAIGKLYATYWILIRAFSKIGDSIELASSLTEVENVVNASFENMASKVDDFTKTSIQDFGMSELMAKQTASTFQAMGKAMNIDTSSIASANSFLSGATDGYVGLADSMADVSLNLTKLTADMASFYNVEQSDVAEDLSAIFTGQTVPLRSYGLDLTQATLSEWALKNGLDADVQSMSQAEKTMLRYQYVLANTKDAQNDFSRTSGTWANQTRILSQQFQQLGAIIGQNFIYALKPMVTWLNSVIAKIIEFAKVISNSLGKIFGWKYEDNAKGMSTDYSAAADAADDLADSTGKAKDAAEDLANATLGIDELNIIQPDSDSSSGSGSGSGSGSSGGSGSADSSSGQWTETDKLFESDLDSLEKLGKAIGDKLSKAMDDIDWDSIYEKARGFGTGLASFLNGLFVDSNLFSSLGSTIAGGINTALNAADAFANKFKFYQLGTQMKNGLISFLTSVNWSTATSAATGWAQGIANFLNGFITPETFGLIGTTISNTINTVIKSAQVFTAPGTGFDFTNFGTSLGTLINNALNIDWTTALTTATSWGNGISEAINGFLQTTNFNNVGSTIANLLNTGVNFAFSAGKTFDAIEMGNAISNTVNGFFSTFDFEGLAETLNTWKDNLVTALTEAIDKINWRDVFQGLWDFVSNLDLGTITIIGLALAWKSGLLSTVGGTIASKIGTKVAAKVGPKISAALQAGTGTSSLSSAGGKIAGYLFAGVAAAIAGWNIGQEIYKAIYDDEGFDMSFTEQWNFLADADTDELLDAAKQVGKDVIDGIFNWDQTQELFDGAGEMFENAKEAFEEGDWASLGKNILEGIATGLVAIVDFFVEPINDILTAIVDTICEIFGIHSPSKEMEPYGKYIGEGLIEGINKIKNIGKTVKKFFTNLGSKIKDKWNDAKEWGKNIGEKIKTGVQDKWNTAKNWLGKKALSAKTKVEEMKDKAKTALSNAKDAIKDKVLEAKTKVEEMKDKAKTALKEAQEQIKDGVFISSKIENIKNKVSTAFNNAKKVVKNGISIKTTVGNIKDKVSTAFKEAKAAVKNGISVSASFTNNAAQWAKDVQAEWDKNKPVLNVLTKNVKMQLIQDKVENSGKKIGYSVNFTYATGGFPEDGLFFANHSELVGKFSNGKTAVANNEQIIAGIQSGVQSAVSEALIPYLAQIANNTLETANKDYSVKIGDRDIVQSYRRGSARMGYNFTS